MLFAATMAVLLGAATAVAQTTSSSGTRSTTDSSSGSTYGSGTSATDSTSSRRDTGTSSTTSSGQTDTTRSSGAYGTGSTSGTSGTGSTSTTGAATTSTDTAGGATTMTGRDASGKLGWMERRFVNKAADHGKTELALAELATQQASNAEVKSFAQKLIEDHKMVNDELTSLAGQKNVKLDDDDPQEDRHYKRLAKKSGMEFDQEFVEMMVDMHEDDVKMFEKASTDAKDSALKSFAAKHVDHLRQHLQQAQSLRSTIMPTGRADASSSTTSDTTGSSSTRSTTGTTDPTSGSAHQSSTSGTSGTTGTPGTTGGSSTNSGSGTGSSSSSSDTTPPRSNR